ncbi:hypothetical protein, partial [Streptomyces phyllanthi]|uniref:hypothetical protein n=1 Tax=Streptomyces phyllanthi TaxID=1803180 RepID=UPI001D15A03B
HHRARPHHPHALVAGARGRDTGAGRAGAMLRTCRPARPSGVRAGSGGSVGRPTLRSQAHGTDARPRPAALPPGARHRHRHRHRHGAPRWASLTG